MKNLMISKNAILQTLNNTNAIYQEQMNTLLNLNF
jgi:hypothetical protein